MSWMFPAAIIGSALFSADSSSNAAQSAADTSRQASDASVAEQRRQYDLSRADQQPFLTAGTGAVNRLAAGVGAGGEFGSAMPFNFNYADYKDPSLQFSLDENLRRMRQGRAAAGTYAGGGGIREEDRYLAGLMSTDYQNAFNRALTGFNANTGERNQLYNRLAGVAGTGQTATNQIGAQGSNMAGNVGNIMMGSAANQGNAMMAAAGARNSAYGGAANMLGRIYGPQLAGGYGNYGYTPRSGGGMDNTYAPAGFNDMPVYG